MKRLFQLLSIALAIGFYEYTVAAESSSPTVPTSAPVPSVPSAASHALSEYERIPNALEAYRESFIEQLTKISAPPPELKDDGTDVGMAIGSSEPAVSYKAAMLDPPYETRCLYPFEGETLEYYFSYVVTFNSYEAKKSLRDMYEQLTCLPANRFNDIALAFLLADMQTGFLLDQQTRKEVRQIIAPLSFVMFEMGNELTRNILHRWIVKNQQDWLAAMDNSSSWLRRVGFAISAGPNLVFVKASQARDLLKLTHSPVWEDGACSYSDMSFIEDKSSIDVPGGMFCPNTCLGEALTTVDNIASEEIVAAYIHPEVQQMCADIKDGSAELRRALPPLTQCLTDLLTPTSDKVETCMAERSKNRFDAFSKPKWQTKLVNRQCWVSDPPKPPKPPVEAGAAGGEGGTGSHDDELLAFFDNEMRDALQDLKDAMDIVLEAEEILDHDAALPISHENRLSSQELSELSNRIDRALSDASFAALRHSNRKRSRERLMRVRNNRGCLSDDINCEQCGVQDERDKEYMACLGIPHLDEDPAEKDLPGAGGKPDPKVAQWTPWSAPDYMDNLIGVKHCQLEVFEKNSKVCDRVLRCSDGQEIVDCKCQDIGATGYSERTLDDIMLSMCAEHIDCVDGEDCSCGLPSLPIEDDDTGGEGPEPRSPVKRAYMHD